MENATNTNNISFFCKGECGVGMEEGEKTITPVGINLCFNCEHKKRKTKKIKGSIPLKQREL